MPALKVNDTLPLVGAKRQDFYDLIEGCTPDTDMADGVTLEMATDKLQAKVAVPRWEKVTIGYAVVKALGAVANGQVTLLTLQDGGIVQAVKIRTKVQWVGTSIATLVADIGTAGTATKYLTGYNLWAAPGDANVTLGTTAGAEAHTLAGGGAGTALKLKVTATGTTLDALSAGSVDVWILWSATV
jgi:hypothetical protein